MTAQHLAAVTPSPANIHVGNASIDGPLDHGWLLGHFKPGHDARHSAAVEVKWGEHPAGDRRTEWVTGEQRTTFLILISGSFNVEFPDRTAPLTQRGDYVTWGPGVDHSWCARKPSTILTVRWPSVPGYAAITTGRSI